MKLTNAQIYTLHRLASGITYQLRGDGKKARECRPCIRNRFATDDISAPSIPVLFRLGQVAFTHQKEKVNSTFYGVALTRAGQTAAATMQIKDR